MKTLFLDFDGVLHTMSEADSNPFCRLHLLHRAVIPNTVQIVISSSWRFHYSWREIKSHMGILAPYLVGTTGPAITERYARHKEIVTYAALYGIGDDWRALDDSEFEFPRDESRLILCDPAIGLEKKQVSILERWLADQQ